MKSPHDALLALLGTTMLSTPVMAQTAATPAVTREADTEIVVTGIRGSLEDALRIKRNSSIILDSISSEGVGKLPDLNLAESLQRLPGVQINRSAQRRTGTVSIRGLPGDFAQTLLNGQYLASPDVSNFAFGHVRSEVFSGIDVQKASGAGSLTGGLSGLINLKTGSPLGAPEQFTVSADGRYEESTRKISPGGAVVLSKEIVPGIFAVRAAIGYQAIDFREDYAQINTYDRVAGGTTTADLSDDVFAPRQVRLPSQLTKGYALSGSLVAQWRPIETLTGTISLFYNGHEPDNTNSQFTFEARPPAVRTALTTTAEGANGSTQSRVRITNPLLIVDTRYADESSRTGATTANLEWADDGWRARGTVHYTKAIRRSNQFGYQAQQLPATTGTNGLVIELDTGAGNLSNFFYDLTGSPLVNLGQPFGNPIAPTFREIRATANPLQSLIGGFRNARETEDEVAFQLDVSRDIDFGPVSRIDVGGIYRVKRQDQFNALQSLLGANLTALNNRFYDFTLFSGSSFLNGRTAVDPADYAVIDVLGLTRAIAPTGAVTIPAGVNASVGPGGIVQIIDSTAVSQTFENGQKIVGGYAEVQLDQQFSDSVRLRGNLGIRYEKSTRDTIANILLPGNIIQPAPSSFAFDNWLPSANLVLELGSKFLVRGSYTRTMRRPQVDSFAVTRSVAVDGTGGLITVNLGASDLKPFISDNFDLSFEWYNRAGSNISLLLFQKKISDFAGATRVCPADGGGFGFGQFTNAGGTCRTVAATPAGNGFPAVRQDAQVNINVTANQSSFKLKGFEVSAQQNLSFLPAPWNGFGAQVNYTYIDFSSSSDFRLSEISQHTFNAIAFYENDDFSIRAAYNKRSSYFLAGAGTQGGADRFVAPRSQIDLTAQVNLNKRLTAKFEVFNLTNEILVEYEGVPTRVRQYSLLGRTFAAGLAYRF